jgi:hypothetical protein
VHGGGGGSQEWEFKKELLIAPLKDVQ